MKNTQIIFLLLILWMPTKAEIDNFNCGVQTDSSFVDERTQIGGWKLSSEGVIKILVVFAKFPDDDSNHNYWPSGGDPIGYQNIIDENETVGSYDVRNLTSYFSEMSFGNYIVIGDAISVTTPQNESSYTNNVGLAATDVMMNVVDPEVDFSDYDNWTRVGTYNQINEPDGKVDLITIVWRKNIWLSNVAGVNTSYVTNFNADGVLVTDLGTTVFSSPGYSLTRTRKIAVHEMGHHLIGMHHPYNVGFQRYALWSILGNPFHSGNCANSYERELLGWINISDIENANIPLSDYITTGVSYKFHPLDGAEDEFYYFENHQKESVFDDATVNSNDKGIFILHAKSGYTNGNDIKAIPSEGFFDIDNPDWVTNIWAPENDPIPGYRLYDENRFGRSKKEQIPYSNPPEGINQGEDWIHALYESPNTYDYGNFPNGYHSIASYNPSTSTVFSPWSNPPARVWHDQNTNAGISMEILNEENGVVTAHFSVDNPVNVKPAKPQNFKATVIDNHPHLTWDVNLEPDNSGYILYQTVTQANGSEQTITFEFPSPTTSFTDYGFNVDARPTTHRTSYYLIAYDTQDKFSDETDSYSFKGQSRLRWQKTS